MNLNIFDVKKTPSAVISCQSAVKVDLQKLLNLTLIHLTKTDKTLKLKYVQRKLPIG